MNMKEQCKKLKKLIIKSAEGKLDPRKDEFRPKDLKINSDHFGSFSDHCAEGTTISSRHCGCGLLKKVSKGKVFKYILIK
jgi:hypothetical protein